jgi:hypothetical protein
MIGTYDAPIIDGYIDECWDAVDPVLLNLPLGTENPTVTAYWKALWSETCIFVLVDVQDGDYYPGWEAGGNGWEYDKPEIYFDVNDTLIDGLGPAADNTGHYQWSPDPTDGGDDTPTYSTKSNRAPGGWYAYVLSGENWTYEFAAEIASMHNGDGVDMTCDRISSLPEKMGFDVTVIDQDEGVTTARQRYIWQSGDGTEAEAWNSMDACGTMTLVGMCACCDSFGFVDVTTVDIAIHPNPVTDFLTIHADFDKVVINNILGREICSMNRIKTNKLDVGYLPKGLYILRVYKGERYIGAVKIAKN